MHCIRKITEDLVWVGANDRRLFIFEGVYSVPKGVSYNAYLLLDEKTVLFDTVDRAVAERFAENVTEALGDRALDYIVVQHMEPDHSSALKTMLARYPDAKIVCNARTLAFIKQFYNFEADSRAVVVGEADTLNTGRHTLRFLMAPMVHWPEVMVTYDEAERVLLSADAFGCFGALNGALFADEVDFSKDYMDEARRYYTNIVGKYGAQVAALLQKTSALDIDVICPLHGFVWRKDLSRIVSKYLSWSVYEPEENGVMIAYASVYGNTENAAEILSVMLREKGVKTVMFDVSVTPASEIISAAFRYSHLVFASTTYNAGIFVTMEAVLNDLVAHNIQNRAVAIIENGSWAASSGALIREKLEKCRNLTVIGELVSLKSGLKVSQAEALEAVADAVAADISKAVDSSPVSAGAAGEIDAKVMNKLTYGLFILTAKDGARDVGCVINTAAQLSSSPQRISITVNKANYTHDVIAKTGEFAVSILTQAVDFDLIKRFGFSSSKDADKFEGAPGGARTASGLRYLPEYSNGAIAAKVSNSVDCGTHTLYIADVTEALVLSKEPSLSYQYYYDNIKPRSRPKQEGGKKMVCRICGFTYDGAELPEGFICPLCKHGAEDFELV